MIPKIQKRKDQLLDKIPDEIDEIDKRLDEIYDEKNDVEYDIENIKEDRDNYDIDEDKLENLIEELKDEWRYDPMGKLKEYGYDNDFISRYIDEDRLIQDIIDVDGYGHTLSIYDGNEYEYYINGTTYYVFRTN